MSEPFYKRCKCRGDDGRELGAKCPKLHRSDGSWNPKHGTWYYALELPAGVAGKRRQMRRGGFAIRDDAEAARDQARAKLRKGADPASRITVGEYLTRWVEQRPDLKRTTLRNYRLAIGTYLVPLLGHIELARPLQAADIADAFATIRAWNGELAAGRPVRKYQRHVGPAAMQRIRGVLRTALNDAVDAGLIEFNPATRVRMEPEKKHKPAAWTAEREQAFRATYERQLAALPPGGRGDRAFLLWRSMSLRPSPVMVWTPEQTGRFLDYAARHRLSPLYELTAATGVRRGEACGLAWPDLDLEAAVMQVGSERVQVGWEVVEDDPKSEAGNRAIPLDRETVAALRAHRKRQMADRLAWGEAWVDSDLVFTREDGAPLHPDYVTDTFERLAFAAGLPPIGFHGLRHGHASYALAAKVDVKIVQERLGHSTSKLTRDTYTTVLDEVARSAAEAVAAMIPRRRAQ
jgi:integrase